MTNHTTEQPGPPEQARRVLQLAARNPRHAVRAAQGYRARAEAADGAGAAWGQYLLGWALLRWECIAPARDQLQAAAAAFAAADDLPMAQHCAYGLLVARQLAGEGPGLQDAWEAFAASCAEQGAWQLAARARAEQIAHLNVLGRPREAYALAEACAPLLTSAGAPADQARFAHVAGVAAAGCGDLGAAAERLERAYAGFVALRQPIDAARVLFERAWIWQRREHFARAQADLERALATFRRFDLPLRIAFCEKDLGTVAAGLGDYAAAIAHTLRARAQFAPLGRADLVARCDLNLGTIAHYTGLLDLAAGAYQRAEAIYTRQGDRRLALICRRNQAMVLAAQGELRAALAIVQALDLPAREVGDRLEHAELLLERAGVLHRLGEHAEALACLHTAHAWFHELGSAVSAAKCRLDEGWLQIDRGDWGAAGACLREAEALLADRPAHRWRALHGLGLAAERSGDPAAALACYEAAGAIVARLRRTLASEHASSGIFAQAGRLYHDALGLAARQGEIERLRGWGGAPRALPLQRQLVDPGIAPPPAVRARRDQLRDQLRALQAAEAPAAELGAALREYTDALLHARHHAGPPAEAPYQPFDLAQTRRHLAALYGDDWTLLAPVLVGDDWLLITITGEHLALDRAPHDSAMRDLLARACQPRYRMATYRGLAYAPGRDSAPWATLHALADRLVPPAVRARLHPGHRLLIAPSGPLHALAWGALRVGPRWLCEAAIIQELPTLGPPGLAALSRGTGAPALLIGCEQFGERARELPGALASLDLVQAHWPGPVERLAGPNATRRALFERDASGDLAHYRLIHIASHAQLSAAGGLLGHIKLSDDDLLIDDLLQLHLGGALVVLAACEGAASEALPGDELLSISHALLAAGASGVVASRWPTYDRAVPELFMRFYRALAGGADAARALALAQRELIGFARADTPEQAIVGTPFIWANFRAMCVGMA